MGDGIVMSVEKDGATVVRIPRRTFAEWACTPLESEFRQWRNQVGRHISPQKLEEVHQYNPRWRLVNLE
jgi:hypothetical protein